MRRRAGMAPHASLRPPPPRVTYPSTTYPFPAPIKRTTGSNPTHALTLAVSAAPLRNLTHIRTHPFHFTAHFSVPHFYCRQQGE